MCTSCSYIFFFSLYGDHRDLHSFPTRRSSDLVTWNAIEDNVIHGAVVIDGYNGFWMGFIRNNVHGLVDRKSTRLNSSHTVISYAVFCLKKKNKTKNVNILYENK